jgi:opacity protein-like surface antigen
VRLRFGYAFDTILPYITGGVAIANFNADIVGAPFGTATATNLGWTAGAGIEFAITNALRAKVEYLHADLNGFSCNVACGGGPVSFNVNANVIRAGLNYRLWTY